MLYNKNTNISHKISCFLTYIHFNQYSYSAFLILQEKTDAKSEYIRSLNKTVEKYDDRSGNGRSHY